MKNYLVVSALGEDRPGLVNELSRVILECDCGIVDSRMTILGGEFAILLLIDQEDEEAGRFVRRSMIWPKKVSRSSPPIPKRPAARVGTSSRHGLTLKRTTEPTKPSRPSSSKASTTT